MSPRDTFEQLFELQGESGEGQPLEGCLGDLVMVLLSDLCRELTISTAVAHGKSMRRHEARERVAEHTSAIFSVLDMCELAGAQVVDGCALEDSPLGTPRRD